VRPSEFSTVDTHRELPIAALTSARTSGSPFHSSSKTNSLVHAPQILTVSAAFAAPLLAAAFLDFIANVPLAFAAIVTAAFANAIFANSAFTCAALTTISIAFVAHASNL